MARKKSGRRGAREGRGEPPSGSLLVSDYDAQLVRQQALLRAAHVAGLDSDLMAPNEIPDSIRVVAPELGRALDEFLRSFEAWHDLHKRVADRQGGLTNAEQAELMRLIREKETARANFVSLMELPTPEAARAWIQDALLPIRDRVALAIERLEAGQWAWRFHLEQSELLVPLSNVAAPIMRSRSFITGTFRSLVAEYDRTLANLLASLRDANVALVQDGHFQEALRTLLEAHLERHAGDKPWGAFPKERMPALAAQYVLNGVEEVSPGSSTMELFWNENGEKLRAAVEESRLRSVRGAGSQLLEIARRLRAEVDDLVDRVSRSSGVVVTPKAVGWYPERF